MGSTVSRRSILLSAGVLGIVGVFAGGTALGYALNDAEPEASTPAGNEIAGRPSTGYQSPFDPYARAGAETDAQQGAGRGGAAPSASAPVGSGDDGVATDAARGGWAPYGLCPAPVGNVFNGSTVDLSAANFAMNLLGQEFQMTSMSVRSEGDCGDGYTATEGQLVLDTSWIHTETGFSLQVSQRVQDEATANMLFPESAQFWSDGYQYTAWVNAYQYSPVDRMAEFNDPATDPRVQQVRDAVVAQLAPEVGVQCFFRQEQGDWSDLAALGIGDPRSVLPAGYTESYSNITRLVEPDSSCLGADLEPQVNAGFNAGFQLSNGEGWLDISAWPIHEAVTYPGYIDSYGANWSNGDWQFSVYGNKGGDALGVETLEAIARVLDPNYNAQCFIRERQLSPDELPGLGFNTPVVPDGYSIEGSSLRVSEIPADCAVEDVAAPNYYLNWTLTNGDNVYEVSVSRTAPVEGEERYPNEGWISDYGINWTADRTSYNIWASSRGVTGVPDRETMVAIAQSLDPSLDVSTLQEGPGYPEPMPMPIEDGPASRPSDGTSSPGAPAPTAAE